MPAHQGMMAVGGLMQDADDARLHDPEHHDRLAEADEAVVGRMLEAEARGDRLAGLAMLRLDPVPLGAADDEVLGPHPDRRARGHDADVLVGDAGVELTDVGFAIAEDEESILGGQVLQPGEPEPLVTDRTRWSWLASSMPTSMCAPGMRTDVRSSPTSAM